MRLHISLMERFVVGTGRCGSTLLSEMLGRHPGLLSIFEFFTGLDAAERFRSQSMDGYELATLIGAEQPMVTTAGMGRACTRGR